MRLSRRQFLKLSGTTSTLLAAGGGGRRGQFLIGLPKARWSKETPTICPYCAVGCGILVGTADGKVVNTEGDPDHPINRGSLCSKGSALRQVGDNPQRLTKPLYRAPGSSHWEERDWNWTLDRIARLIKSTRDEGWIEREPDGKLVNRTESLAWLGGAALDNEECALGVKFARALGLVYVEHQARI
jgi:anaerobic selenocysteine-containing dehydrogenase